MENKSYESQNYKLSFDGKGSSYFGIIIVNWLLTVLTLGIYYPWAKARQLKFMYGSTALNNDNFSFHGTGKEMFIGFLKTIFLFAVILGSYFSLLLLDQLVLAIIVLYVFIIPIMPLAIHGSYRYRMSRTSWRGIRFGYRGEKKDFFLKFIQWFLLTIITFGIYGSWFSINMRSYIMNNVRAGNVEFKYKAEGSDYFWMNLKGYFLSIITLGIYMFWWQKDIFAFYVDNLSLQKDNTQIKMKSTASGGDFFGLLVVNLLIIIFTLGLGYAWAETRTMTFICEKIHMYGDIDLDSIAQTEENYADATGDDVADFLDIDFVI